MYAAGWIQMEGTIPLVQKHPICDLSRRKLFLPFKTCTCPHWTDWGKPNYKMCSFRYRTISSGHGFELFATFCPFIIHAFIYAVPLNIYNLLRHAASPTQAIRDSLPILLKCVCSV